MLCAKFGWNWPSGSGEEEIFNFINIFWLYHNYLPLKKDRALHLNKLQSPSPKDTLCQVWFKLAQWFWRRRWKGENITPTTTTTRMTRTDNRQILIRKALTLEPWLRWANKYRYFKENLAHWANFTWIFLLSSNSTCINEYIKFA